MRHLLTIKVPNFSLIRWSEQ